jgi:hypothetical protein
MGCFGDSPSFCSFCVLLLDFSEQDVAVSGPNDRLKGDCEWEFQAPFPLSEEREETAYHPAMTWSRVSGEIGVRR